MTAEIIELSDPASGAVARVLPAVGFNCFSFRVPLEGRGYELLWSAAEFATATGPIGARWPARSGIPILFPFAGRITGGRFEYGGRAYQIGAPVATVDDGGNAIHGFAMQRPFALLDRSPRHVSGRFSSSSDSSLAGTWPGEYELTVRHEVSGTSLVSRFEVKNPGPGPLPWALGTHGYFRPPIERAADLDQSMVQVPVGCNWELVDLLPTGRTTTGQRERTLSAGMPYGETRFDNVFGNLAFDGDWCNSTITSPQSGRRLVFRFDRAFSAAVVFNPPHREAICVEPYTTIPDAFRLTAEGIDAGLRTLAPGETATLTTELKLE